MDNPDLYAGNGGPVCAMNSEVLDELWPILSWSLPGLPVLDVGCGPGEVAKTLLAPRLPEGTRIVGADSCSSMLAYAKQHNTLNGVITYEQLDVMASDLQKTALWGHAPFGKAFALLLLHWVHDNKIAVRNIYKLLAPGGEAVFTVKVRSHYFAHEYLQKHTRWQQYVRDVNLYLSPYHYSEDPLGDFRRVLIEAGFEIVHCSMKTRRHAYESEEQMKGILTSVNPFVKNVPPEERDEFMRDVVQANYSLQSIVVERSSDGKTKPHYDFPLLEAVVRKPNNV